MCKHTTIHSRLYSIRAQIVNAIKEKTVFHIIEILPLYLSILTIIRVIVLKHIVTNPSHHLCKDLHL